VRRARVVVTVLSLLLVAGLAAGQREPFADLKPTVILVSFDGFRWDYPTKMPTPNLNRLMARGVHARNLIPSFPSKTFPNHYTIVTGLYPGHHGIVANNIYDPPTGKVFAAASRAAVQDPMWWGGVPIWTVVEKAHLFSAPLFWPGSEAPHDGIMPKYWEPYNMNTPATARINEMFAWLDLPAAQRPVFLTLYFEDTDEAGHASGPDSQDVRDAIARDDGYVGDIVAGLTRRGILDRVNLVVVSDHGMTPVDDEHVIVADDYVNPDDVVISNINPDLSLFPKAGKEDAVYRALEHASPHMKVYKRADIPARWHFRDHPRVPSVLGIAEDRWQILRRATVNNIKAGKVKGGRGQHGYDPQYMSMRAFFAAAGPAFKSGLTVAPFENVSIYDVLAKALGVTAPPNDGDPAVAREVLR